MAYPISFTVGIMGNISSVLFYLAPIGTFWRVIRKKSTENFKGLPCITALLSTSLWTFYGTQKPGGLLLVTVNAIGAFIQVIYIALYLIYAPKEVEVPNAVGFILGSAQLILYAIYQKKSVSRKSEERKDEDDSAQQVKREVEMEAYDDNSKAISMKNNSTRIKGRSLAKPSIARQYSLNKMMRTGQI